MNRECGQCNACCIVFDIDEMQKKAGDRCERLCPTGCSRYDDRPSECRAYRCAWLNGVGDDDMRPDLLGVVIDARSAGKHRIASAMEVWAGASKEPRARAAIDAIASGGAAVLVQSPRAGRLEVVGRRDVLTLLRIEDSRRMDDA